MRIALGLVASAVVLLIAGATAALPGWSVPVGASCMTIGSLLLAIAMESKDLRATAPS